MARRGKRGLTPEEEQLWDKVKRSSNPMHKKRVTPRLDEILTPTKVPEKPRALAPFRVGEKKTATAPVPLPTEKLPAVNMDKKAFGRMTKGKLKPESRIDLHGMTVARAHGVLTTFIQDSHARGLRLVLVITGKGKDKDDGGPIPTPRGVLKRQVPMWLGVQPLSPLVLQVTEAHGRHGGSGAYYVYLRRHR